MRDYTDVDNELTDQDLMAVTGGTLDYTTMQWEYTKQDDTGAAKGTTTKA